jgi:hypothetical protein
MGELVVVPLGADRLADLARLFVTSRTTRHCWCTALCSTSRQFALGWYGGGKPGWFEALPVTETDPMGTRFRSGSASVADTVLDYCPVPPDRRAG